MSGHGWVKPRADGAKARCGGPAICKECQREAGVFHGRQHPAEPARVDPLAVALARVAELERGQALAHTLQLAAEREAQKFRRAWGQECARADAALLERDEALREKDAWIETAAQYGRNSDFYRDIVHQVGERFGKAAYTSDDDSIQDGVLALKVPELVDALRAQLQRARDIASEMDHDSDAMCDEDDCECGLDTLRAALAEKTS